MVTQSLRGFRDFYPEDQYRITFLRKKIAAICSLFGYEEVEGPAVEPFELYAAKSSDEIVNEQSFVFEDRGGEKITLRPELTPTLARMVAAKQNELVFPLRWWSFGRFWRYERPQKGRGREFYQWNCDIVGDDSISAEVEIVEIIIRFLQSLGLTEKDVVIEIGDRDFFDAFLSDREVKEEKKTKIFRIIDRAGKLSPEEIRDYSEKQGFEYGQIQKILVDLQNAKNLAPDSPVRQITAQLTEKGLGSWVDINFSMTRGFDYYTGTVFEVSDREKKYRAILGGGRYKNLVAQVGGAPAPGIGFGMGDMVLLSYLEEKGLIPAYKSSAKVVMIGLDPTTANFYQSAMARLRDETINVIEYPDMILKKGLKYASKKGIPFAIIIGVSELKEKKVMLKNLTTGEQELLSIDEAVNKLK